MGATPEEIENSVYLHAYMTNDTLLVVLTKNADEVKLVRRLFAPPHRTQVKQGARWHVRSLHLYKDMPLVKHAKEAYRRQYNLEGRCPALEAR